MMNTWKNKELAKVKVAISACLLGQAVRYDGKSKTHALIQQYILPHVEAIPICPEVGSGMGVPREKIQLVKSNEQIRVLRVLQPDIDVTQQLSDFAKKIQRQYPDLAAMILKSKSPSCGIHSTPIFENDRMIKIGAGQFAYTLKSICPELIMLEENKLSNKANCMEFLSQLGL